MKLYCAASMFNILLILELSDEKKNQKNTNVKLDVQI